MIPLFVNGILNKTPVYINGDGEQTRDFTYIQNAVQVNVKGMLSIDQKAMNQINKVAVGEQISVKHLDRAVQASLKSEHQPTYREPRAGDIKNSLADISLAKQLLGYEPSVKFEEGLKETIDFFKNQYENKP